MSFLDCNIWEVPQFPKYGNNTRYTVANIYKYNSNTKVYNSNIVHLQIPEFEIFAKPKQIILINRYLEDIIEYKIPVLVNLKKRGHEEIWHLDTTLLDYFVYKNNKEK